MRSWTLVPSVSLMRRHRQGCMIVEIQDYRAPRSKDKKTHEDKKVQEDVKQSENTRVVLWPNGETMWADLCILNQKLGNKWTDQEALGVEARILVFTVLVRGSYSILTPYLGRHFNPSMS